MRYPLEKEEEEKKKKKLFLQTFTPNTKTQVSL